MPRERLAPVLAAVVIGVIVVAGLAALVVQAFDGGDSDAGQLVSVEVDGTKLRLELDLGALGLDEEDLEAFEAGGLPAPLLRALLARIGFADEDLDFEGGGLDALRELFGGGDDDAGGAGALAELLEQFRENGLPGDELQRGPLLDRFRFDGRPQGEGLLRVPARPLLGVALSAALVVESVTPGSAAAAAGIEVGDTIRSVDGVDVASVEALRRAIAAVTPLTTYALGVSRGDRALTLEVERPEVAAATFDGIAPGVPIDGAQLRPLIEALRNGRIELRDLPPQLRELLQRVVPDQLPRLEPAPSRG